jgi:flagellar basal body-associated protein FliL
MKYSYVDNTDSQAEKSNLSKLLAIIVLIIILLLAIFLTTAHFIKKYSTLTKNENINSDVRAIAASLPKEPSTLFSRGGKITDIQSEYIVVQTRVRTDSLVPASAYEIRNLAVYYDINTEFTKKSIAEFNQTGIMPASEPASRNDLRIGDSVNVTANVNIKNLTTFTATEIELIY